MSKYAAGSVNTVSVGTSSTVIVGTNVSRSEITIVNDGANTVYLQFSSTRDVAPTAVASQGIRLNSGGGSFTTSSYKGAVAGIALTGATVVTVAEF